MAMRKSVGRVGNNFPLSSFDSKAAERPVCLPNSTSPMLLRSRMERSFSPIEYRPKPSEIVSVMPVVISL
jgi:hypothetical protein